MSGIPAGARTTPVPDVFFSRFLPQLTDPAEVTVALVALWLLHRRPTGAPPVLGLATLAAEPALRQALLAQGCPEARLGDRVVAAVARLVAIGLLADAGPAAAPAAGRRLVVNSPAGRAARRRLADPKAAGAEAGEPPEALPLEAAGPGGDRPTIYRLYEDTIGLVTPILAEELREAEATYPPAWLARAFRLAAENNARKWSYVRAILERWARDGVEDEGHRRGAEAARQRDSDGPFAAWVER
jgi:DnaD/phage-associated family protein